MPPPTLPEILVEPVIFRFVEPYLDAKSLNALRQTIRDLRRRGLVRQFTHDIHGPRLRMELPEYMTPEDEAAARKAAEREAVERRLVEVGDGGGGDGAAAAAAAAPVQPRRTLNQQLVANRHEVMYEITPLSHPRMMFEARAMIVESPEALRHLIATAQAAQTPYAQTKTLVLRSHGRRGLLKDILSPAGVELPNAARALPPPGADARDLAVRGAPAAPLVPACRPQLFPNLQHLESVGLHIDASLLELRGTLQTLCIDTAFPGFQTMFQHGHDWVVWPKLRRLKTNNVFNAEWLTNCLPNLTDLALMGHSVSPAMVSMPKLKRLELAVTNVELPHLLRTPFPQLQRLHIHVHSFVLQDAGAWLFRGGNMPRLRHIRIEASEYSRASVLALAHHVESLELIASPTDEDAPLNRCFEPGRAPSIVSLKRLVCDLKLFLTLYKTTTIASTLTKLVINTDYRWTPSWSDQTWSGYGVFTRVTSVKFTSRHMDDRAIGHLARLFPNVRDLSIFGTYLASSLKGLERLEHLRVIPLFVETTHLTVGPSERIARMLHLHGDTFRCDDQSDWRCYNTVQLSLVPFAPLGPLPFVAPDLAHFSGAQHLIITRLPTDVQLSLQPVAHVPSLTLQWSWLDVPLDLRPLRSTRMLELVGHSRMSEHLVFGALEKLTELRVEPGDGSVIQCVSDAWKQGLFPALETIVFRLRRPNRLHLPGDPALARPQHDIMALFSNGGHAVANIFSHAVTRDEQYLQRHYHWNERIGQYVIVASGHCLSETFKRMEPPLLSTFS